jgi:hypothetical protein
MNKVARLKTRKKPAMSVTVVNNGPEATAGSIPKFFNINGTVPPNEADSRLPWTGFRHG